MKKKLSQREYRRGKMQEEKARPVLKVLNSTTGF
jgi:hypothetical protein